ncbi:MAG: N-acetylmuramoyl-L-alanine amidase [Lachnospiraceae bacterium]|uniref:N-acetylmuramoyl-L-alanine amidase n=1 Tax=Candidatus Merdisoma sp. JLR.KK011 TaxID=3114299 RepID=UPI001434EFD2|nr:N-acetylmuramoyl-L-alanine amidase [Lachnospiraceae bacterium]MCI9250453.1 N-acetylmuramoyl-L-alanine amidase [Lachnospiraceae bacterium]MCI9477639.1 N-acetylmuramoyl-L-alanine amidase [Lachnospiraceae bacterium]MCI9621865.1 N-acetylmuramoyl-L-alanine amidase [Lachnospiraceae bacterium]GFI08196.1 sporulation-specific N-acetylmuramoyl-L-alanine amidase [Lachnospiraceae bacterium]
MATKIVVDAGHGGSNPGAVYQGRRESDDALRLAMAVGKILESNGYDVTYTRTSDVTQSVGQKAAIANEEGADLFVSIHRNAGEYPGQYSGVQTLIYDDSGIKKQMAENIDANLEALGFRNAGVSIRPNLVVLNSTQMPALLVEAGFIDSDTDNRLFDSRFQAMAQAIADGIMETLEGAQVTSSNVSEEEPGEEGRRCPPMDRPPHRPPMRPPMPPMPPAQPEEPEELYRVQAGAFRERQNADNLLQLLENDGFPAFIVYQDGLYKVQVGAFSRLSNAIAMEREVREKGYNTYITT